MLCMIFQSTIMRGKEIWSNFSQKKVAIGTMINHKKIRIFCYITKKINNKNKIDISGAFVWLLSNLFTNYLWYKKSCFDRFSKFSFIIWSIKGIYILELQNCVAYESIIVCITDLFKNLTDVYLNKNMC
jgi:hypothetical protein